MHSLYDITKSYKENYKNGPYYTGTIPKRIIPSGQQWIDCLGYRIASPIGIPACPIMHSKGIALASKLGYDIVTYKTIRTKPHAVYPHPNITFIETSLADQQNIQQSLVYATHQTQKTEISITNSFGNNCFDALEIQYDIQQARSVIAPWQVLMVSIYGNGKTKHSVIQDFVDAAQLAYQAGAQIIEVNLSCPNIFDYKSILYKDSTQLFDIVKPIVQKIPIPVTIKVGNIADTTTLRNILYAAARAGTQGICGINSIPMNVVATDGNPVFGKKRIISGVSGALIRNSALDFINATRTIIDQEKLDLKLFGTGGICLPEHFDLFFNAGAHYALSATGAMFNPLLAYQYHK